MRIGVDLLKVDRIERLIDTYQEFIPRFFSEGEEKLYHERSENPLTLASNFALKEAFVKAMGTGLKDYSLSDIEVLRKDSGEPYIHTLGNLQTIFKKKGYQEVLASLSHDGDYVVGMVVIL
ncbi:holo-ACP synthase [Guggenheimella bovis]